MLTCWKMEKVDLASFFNFYTNLAESSCVVFAYLYHVLFSANIFAHAQTYYRMRSLCRSSMVKWSYSWIYEYYAGKHWILYGTYENLKQRHISFVPGMILWKISTAISIKHRILATFNIKKNQSERLYAFKVNFT